MEKHQTFDLTFTEYPTASNASSPIKKSRSSIPFVNRLVVWSPILAVSRIAIAEGIMHCGSLLGANPNLVYLRDEKFQLKHYIHDDQSLPNSLIE